MVKMMLICAESSGDFLAAELVDALKEEIPNISFTDSFIGQECQKKGLRSVADMSQIAKMGFFEIRRLILSAIAQQKPECIILVDGFAFTHFVAKKIKKQYPDIKLVKYIAPKLWAWASWRAYKLKIYDRVLTCLPFEVDFFKRKNIAVSFVGHSVLQRIHFISDIQKQAFKVRHNIPDHKKIILLLCGSRHSEISRLKDIFLQVSRKFDPQKHHFIIPIASQKSAYFSDISSCYTILTEADDRFKAFQIADAALAASGTVSLELMIASVPTVIAYKVSYLSALLARWLVNVPYVTLLNIMLNKPVFPEFLQNNCTIDQLYPALNCALYDTEKIVEQKQMCQKATKMLSVYENESGIIPSSIVCARIIKKLIFD